MKTTQSGRNYVKLLDYIKDNLAVVGKKKISPEKLQALGYSFTKRNIELVTGDVVEFFVAELIDEGITKPASFCYLYNVAKNEGFILPDTYEHYLHYLLTS